MSKSKYLIVGGSGFVGTFLIKELLEYNISNFDRQYSGSAKQPEKLSEPSDDAIKELEKLIEKIS